MRQVPGKGGPASGRYSPIGMQWIDAVETNHMRGGEKVMKKSWVMLLVIVLTGFLATAVYAQPKMVIVLEPGNPNFFQCYRIQTFSAGTAIPTTVQCSDDSPGSAPNYNQNLTSKIRDRHAAPPNNGHNNHKTISVPDSTLIFSNPCVTYWYHGHSYTVCN